MGRMFKVTLFTLYTKLRACSFDSRNVYHKYIFIEIWLSLLVKLNHIKLL